MKAIYNLSAALAALLLAACGNDETFGEPETTPAGNQVTMTFTSNAPAPAADTRTSLVEGTRVYWTPGDVIGVYSCTSENYSLEGLGTPFTTDLTDDTPTASFTGEATEGTQQYIAVYPQDKFAGCMWSPEMTVLVFTLPTEQTAVAGGFATGLNPSLATTADMGGDLNFKNLCALVKFRISGGEADELESVTLTDLGGTGLSGTAMYVKSSSMEAVDADVISVTLTGSFTTGTDYYFVVVPSVDNNYAPAAPKNGFSLTFTRQDGTSFVKAASGGIGDTNLAAGMILDLGEIDLSGATYQEAITNSAFINAVGEQVKWEVTGGIVYLTDANKQAIEAVTSLNIENKNLTDISGIKYFTKLTNLNCGNNQLTELPVGNLTQLTSLKCSDNQLTALPVENLTNLTLLYSSNNQLTALPVEKLTKLTELNCGTNLLTKLDIENLTQLTKLYCNNNQLTALPVGKLNNLNVLNCHDNRLTELDITSVTSLNSLYCGNQTNAAGEPQTLTLILTSAQKATWESKWGSYDDNARVSVEVKDLGSTNV